MTSITKTIVGIDPGSKTCIAIIDIDSNGVIVFSKKNDPKGGLVGDIAKFGTPILIATDTKRPPKLVKRIAASFGARVWTPRKDVTVSLKNAIEKKFAKYSNHERDALASAVLARRRFSKLFERIEKKVAGQDIDEILVSDVKALVIKKRMNISKAVKLIEAS